MRVTSINNHNYSQKTQAFKSVNRFVNTKDGRIYQTFTQFYRNDLNWGAFIEFLENKYKNIPKVNIFNFACSEGAEAYSLAISLLENVKDNVNKYFPIFASDIDKNNIEVAQKGCFEIKNIELYRINKNTKNKFDKYFVPTTSSTGEISKLETKDFLKEKVEFKIDDILSGIKRLPKTNSVFLIRNVWPYLDIEEKSEILRELATLDKSCCVAIGEIDAMTDVGRALDYYGFKRTPVQNVYEKEF